MRFCWIYHTMLLKIITQSSRRLVSILYQFALVLPSTVRIYVFAILNAIEYLLIAVQYGTAFMSTDAIKSHL